MGSIEEIKKSLETKKAVIGTDKVIKNLKLGKLKQVFLTSNTPEEIKQTIKHYAKANKTKVVQLRQPNEELGTICKKPFAISVLGIKGA